jgi:NAD(P)-dependent dehydrogenase (short-subunit alcohol dehydrogenase family)
MAAGRVILIAGANCGLGLAIVRVAETRDASAHYILAYRDVGAGEKAINEPNRAAWLPLSSYCNWIPPKARPLPLLSSVLATLMEDLMVCLRQPTAVELIQVLINNAGIARFSQDDSFDMSRAAYTDMTSVNVSSVACMCHTFQPQLAKSPAPKSSI